MLAAFLSFHPTAIRHTDIEGKRGTQYHKQRGEYIYRPFLSLSVSFCSGRDCFLVCMFCFCFPVCSSLPLSLHAFLCSSCSQVFSSPRPPRSLPLWIHFISFLCICRTLSFPSSPLLRSSSLSYTHTNAHDLHGQRCWRVVR